jgi:hypothetical protein
MGGMGRSQNGVADSEQAGSLLNPQPIARSIDEAQKTQEKNQAQKVDRAATHIPTNRPNPVKRVCLPFDH